MLKQRVHHEVNERVRERVLTVNYLQDFFNKIEFALESLKEVDPNSARSGTAEHEVKKALGCYKEILAEKTCKAAQTLIDSYFMPSTPSTQLSVSSAPSFSSPTSPVASTSYAYDQNSPAPNSPTPHSPAADSPDVMDINMLHSD